MQTSASDVWPDVWSDHFMHVCVVAQHAVMRQPMFELGVSRYANTVGVALGL